MMQRFLRLPFRFGIQSKTLRWLTAAVVLFSLFVPQIGVCRCMSCECCEPALKAAEKETETVSTGRHSCCSRKTESRQAESDCPTDEKPVSHSCPCRIQSVHHIDGAVLQPALSLQNLLEEWSGLHSPVILAPADVFPSAAAHYFCYENQYRLPVRLHLFLQKMRN